MFALNTLGTVKLYDIKGQKIIDPLLNVQGRFPTNKRKNLGHFSKPFKSESLGTEDRFGRASCRH